MLDDIIQISPRPLPDQEQFFLDWIAFLRTQSEPEADTWLREAVRLSGARQGWRPWRVPRGCSARVPIWTGVPRWRQRANSLLCSPLRTRPCGRCLVRFPCALLWRITCAAATHLHDTAPALRLGRWEAFIAKPALARLLDVWEVTPAGAERTRQMSQAAQHVRDTLPPDQVPSVWVDAIERPVWPDKSVLAHAYLLAGDWDAAYPWPCLSRSWVGVVVTTHKGWSCPAASCRCLGYRLAGFPKPRNCGIGNSRTVRVLCPGIVPMQEKPACSYACSTPTRSACPRSP